MEGDGRLDGKGRWTGRDGGGRVNILLRGCRTSRSRHGHGNGTKMKDQL